MNPTTKTTQNKVPAPFGIFHVVRSAAPARAFLTEWRSIIKGARFYLTVRETYADPTTGALIAKITFDGDTTGAVHEIPAADIQVETL